MVLWKLPFGIFVWGNRLNFGIHFFSPFIRFGDEIPGMEGLGTGEYILWNVAF